MFFQSLLLLITMAGKVTESSITCDGVIFKDQYYDKDTLFEGLGRPYNLMMHKYSGLLFFSHTIQNGSHVDFGIMACHVEKKTCRNIPGIAGGYAIFYDQGADEIYFGGLKGIHRYDFNKKIARYVAEGDKSIWALFIRKRFYFIEYPSQKLYVYRKGKFIPVKPAANMEIDNFFISRFSEVFFSNDSGLYKIRKPNKHPYPEKLSDKIYVRQITEDNMGDIYFCANDGIYMEDPPNNKVKKVADIVQPYGISFIRVYSETNQMGQFIYSDQDSIYRLLPSKAADMCLDVLLSPEEKRRRKMLSNVTSFYAH